MIKLRYLSLLAIGALLLAGNVNQALASKPDEAALRSAADGFEKMFNAGDAKGIAAQWTEDGDYVNQNGKRFVGRAAIQAEYEKFFKAYPGVQIQIEVDSVRMLSPDSAIKEGTATLGSPEVSSPVSSSYLIVHVKKNGKWMVASARDVTVEATSNKDRVPELGKFIGTWESKIDGTIVQTKCRWLVKDVYLERKFTVTMNGKSTLNGVQIIGWNPRLQQITSWLFDSTGGQGEGTWSPYQKGWAIDSVGVTAEGVPTSSVSLLAPVDAETISWQSVNRMLGDSRLADTGKVLLKKVDE